MNKQELIEKVEALPDNIGLIRPHIDKKIVLGLVRQLDEPEKAKVPWFVAEYIKWAKKEDFHLLGAMNRENFDKKLDDWFYTDDNIEVFARAWLDGYEVGKVKRYRVRFKGFNRRYVILKYDQHDKTWFVGGEIEFEFYREEHTRKQLEEAGFGWMFDCPGIEIEEVQDET